MCLLADRLLLGLQLLCNRQTGFNRDLTAPRSSARCGWRRNRSASCGKTAPPYYQCRIDGHGEPLLNFDNVVDAIHLMMHDNCYGISKRRVTLSTSGVVPALDRLGEYTDCCLAISARPQ